MDLDDVETLVDEIESGGRDDKAEEFERLAARCGPGEYGRDTFLQLAGEHWMTRGDLERAERAFAAVESSSGELEERGELRLAHRWFTVPLADFDPLEDRHELDPLCLLGRTRVRRALGLPRDRYDDLADRMRPGMLRRVAPGE